MRKLRTRNLVITQLILFVIAGLTFFEADAQSCGPDIDPGNMIVNGGFESGDELPSEISNHLFLPDNHNHPNSQVQDCMNAGGMCSFSGSYDIVQNVDEFNSFVPAGEDDLVVKDGDFMLLVDAIPVTNGAIDFYAIDIPVKPNCTYLFSSWFAPLGSTSVNVDTAGFVSDISFRLEYPGGPFTFPDIFDAMVPDNTIPGNYQNNWEQYVGIPFTVPDGVNSVRLIMTFIQPAVNAAAVGNDWAIDDIRFDLTCDNCPAPEPQLEPIDTCLSVISSGIDLYSNVSNSSGDITYTWYQDGANMNQNSNSINVTQPGTYYVCIDSAGCHNNTQVDVTGIDDPSGTLTPTQPTCPGENGDLSLNLNGGVDPATFSYVWSHDPMVTSQNLTDIPGGTYTVTFTDANGCSGDATETIDPIDPFDFSIDPTQPSCGATDGVIAINGFNGGTPNYTYNLTNTSGFDETNATGSFTDLASGTYTMTVTDAGLCDTVFDVTLNSSDGPEITTVNIDPTACRGNNGSITVQVTGGTPDYSFNVTNTIGFDETNATGVFDNLAAGTYDIRVLDDNNCPVDTSVTVDDSPGPEITDTNNTNPNCGRSGAIEVIASGGTTPLQYSINDTNSFVNSNNFTGLTAGTYWLWVRDDNGCKDSIEVTLTSPDVPVITQLDSIHPKCAGNDGEIAITISGGVTPITIRFQGDDFTGNNATFQDLSDGIYPIQVEDNNGCIIDTSVSLAFEPVPVLDTISTIPPTCGENNGEIRISVTNGTPTYNFLVNNADSLSDDTYTGLGAGLYNIIVTDINGCKDTMDVTLNDSPGPSLSFTSIDPNCDGFGGEINMTATGGTAPINYSVTHNDGTVQQNQTGNFNNVLEGDYSLLIRDGNGCTASTTATLTDLGGPIVIQEPLPVDATGCGLNNGSVSLIVQPSPGVNNTIQYSYDFGPWTTSNSEDNLAAGTHTIRFSYDDGTCLDNRIFPIDEDEPGTFQPIPTNPECDSTPAAISISLSPGFHSIRFAHENGSQYLFDTILPEPGLFRIEDVLSGTFGNFIITPENNCTMEFGDIFVDYLDCPPPIIIPNVFTPNGDNINELFIISGLDYYKDATLKIVNRWGNTVFKMKGDNFRYWDGNNDRSSPLPIGTYYFTLDLNYGKEFEFKDVIPERYSGDVTVLR